MAAGTKTKLILVGIFFLIIGITGLGFAIYTNFIAPSSVALAADGTPLDKPNPAPQIIGVISSAIGFGFIVAGTKKDEA
jgi:hypothetical protein